MKCPTSSKDISKLLIRIGFGGAIAGFGLAHYLDLQGFSAMVTGGFSGAILPLAKLWVYILPLLMIVGGILFIANYRTDIAAWCAGIALVSIAVGMPLKAVLGSAGLGDVAPAVHNAFLWLIVYYLAVKSLCCGTCESHGPEGGGQPGPM